MARIDPFGTGYSATEFVIPQDRRQHLCASYRRNFTDDDFIAMQIALSLCANTYKSRKGAPDKGAILGHLQKVAGASSNLLSLLEHHYRGDPSSPEEDAVTRIRRLSVRTTGAEENENDGCADTTSLPTDIVTLCCQYISFLETCSLEAKKHVESLDTQSCGGDSTHTRRLLNELKPIFQRHGLKTTVVSDGSGRRSTLADFAFELAALLPAECRPSHGGLIECLVKMNREAKQRFGR